MRDGDGPGAGARGAGDRAQERSPGRREARLQAVREALTVDLDRVTLRSLASALADRQRARTRRGRILVAAGTSAALALLVVVSERRRPVEPAPAPAAPMAASAGRPKILPAPQLAGPAGAREPEGAAAGLPDQAADFVQAAERWAAYARSPSSSTALPDVSHAGYRFGDPSPRPAPARLVNVKQPPFGAAGDGATDDTAALRRALDSVEAEGGVVYLPDGDYRISGVLFVHGNGTVIRGESRTRTRLLFSQTLDEALGPSMAGPLSRWEWAGGLLWFGPRSRQSQPARGARAADRPEIWPGGSPGWARHSWPIGPPVARVIGPAARGDRTLALADTRRLRAGDLVFLVVPASEALLAAGWTPTTESGGRKGAPVVRWPVEIAGVHGNHVTLAQPLRFDVPAADPGHEGRSALLAAIPAAETIRDVGVERLTLVMQRPRGWGPERSEGLRVAEPFGWNGAFFLNAVHGFARQVTVLDGDLGMATMASKNVTLEDIELRSEGLPPGMRPHRALAIRAQSHDVLVQGLTMDARWRGVRLEGSGFVISRARGHFSYLAGRAADSVLTDVTQVGDGPPGSEGSLLEASHRVVGWNLRRRASGDDEQVLLAPGVPGNLYEAQRRLRLTSPPR